MNSALLILFCCIIAGVLSQNCPGKPNNNPIYTGEPRLINTTKNGKLFIVGEKTDSLNPTHILHTWGTPYEMGFAQGELLKEECLGSLTDFFEVAEHSLDEYLQWMPQSIRDIVERIGMNAMLDLTWEATRFYTPKYWEEEMRGLADAVGVDWVIIRRLHMFPELIKASCSMFGAWGPATPNGKLLQLRSLDFGIAEVLYKRALVHVRHPLNSTYGHSYATLTWAGFIGGLTGMSSNSMGISEKYGDITFGGDSRIGYPFHYLLRDILQFDDTLDSSISRMVKTKRTCSIYIGVGDQKLGYARLFQYSAQELNVWDDKNQWNTTTHPQLDNVVYQGVRTQCFHKQLKAYSSVGKLTAENTIANIIPISSTGDAHAAIYDFEYNTMYFSNGRPKGETTGPKKACDRTFIKLDMTKLFAVTL